MPHVRRVPQAITEDGGGSIEFVEHPELGAVPLHQEVNVVVSPGVGKELHSSERGKEASFSPSLSIRAGQRWGVEAVASLGEGSRSTANSSCADGSPVLDPFSLKSPAVRTPPKCCPCVWQHSAPGLFTCQHTSKIKIKDVSVGFSSPIL